MEKQPSPFYKTSNPSGIDRSFLLIVWLVLATNTSRIVARHVASDIGSGLTEHRRIHQGFQHLVGFL